MNDEIKYAIYLVLVEDTNEAYDRLKQEGGVDTIETIKLDLEYDEAVELIQEKAWG